MSTLHHLGRFSFQLPNDYLKTGGSQSLYGVNLFVEGAEENGKKQFEKRKAALQLKAGKALTFETMDIGIQDAYVTAYYEMDANTIAAKYIAQKGFGNNVLVAEFTGRKDRSQAIIGLFSAIFKHYSMGIQEGFVIGQGTLTSEHSVNESALANFMHSTKTNIELIISLNTVGSMDEEGHPLSEIESEKEFLANEGILLEVITNEERTIGNKHGYEGIVSIIDNKEVSYRFTWFQPGIEKNALRPNVLIRALIGEAELESFKTDWKILITSIGNSTGMSSL